jgi:Uma2 family endonuclease
METITLSKKSPGGFSEAEFYQFCLDNPELKFERSAAGLIYIMANTGGNSGKLNALINYFLTGWNLKARLGITFDSSTTFRLPNGAVRSPDAAWVRADRWQALTDLEQRQFPPLCPDFVIELRSETDSLRELQAKMTDEWLANGCQLGWLIDPANEIVYVYRPEADMETVQGFDQQLSGSGILPDFRLNLTQLK